MKRIARHLTRAGLAALLAGAGILPASAQDWGPDHRGPGRWDWAPGEYRLEGRGVPMLFPRLRDTPRGRAFVMRNFDWNHDGFISPREADAANRAFEGLGPDRGRFDGPPPGRDLNPPPPPAPAYGGGWDARAMHGYGFRQTPRGAMMRMDEDVLFATDSAVLRPGAVEKLRALASYLRDQSGVRVAIDGYTDSRGSDAHNQDLSERRAASVREAFDAMGVTRARFTVAGHGERDPIAKNSTAAGMRLNRRVEITLLGRRASEF